MKERLDDYYRRNFGVRAAQRSGRSFVLATPQPTRDRFLSPSARAQDYFDFVAGAQRPDGQLSENDKAIRAWLAERDAAAPASK